MYVAVEGGEQAIDAAPQFNRSCGLVFGMSERKAISIALVDRDLTRKDLGEDNVGAPVRDEKFSLSRG